jgi:hypothetical protein
MTYISERFLSGNITLLLVKLSELFYREAIAPPDSGVAESRYELVSRKGATAQSYQGKGRSSFHIANEME